MGWSRSAGGCAVAAGALVAAAALVATPASARVKHDTTRVATQWMVTASGTQSFSWSASAISPAPQCPAENPGAPARQVTGSGNFQLSFSTPRPFRAETVQVVQRAYKNHSQRSLSYAPPGAPKLEDPITIPASATLSGSFVDQVLACDSFSAYTDTAPTTGCGQQSTSLRLSAGFSITGANVRDRPSLHGDLVHPASIGADGKSACPTYESIAVQYFNGGKGTAACPDFGVLDAELGPAATGLASTFLPGHYLARLTSAHPRAFTLTADVPLQCTLTPSDNYLPALAPSGSLTITGHMHATWTYTPKPVTGPSARVHPL